MVCSPQTSNVALDITIFITLFYKSIIIILPAHPIAAQEKDTLHIYNQLLHTNFKHKFFVALRRFITFFI